MNESLPRLIGPAGGMPRLRRGVRARMVTTHGHDRPPIPGWRPLRQVGHRDFRTIPAGGRWTFPLMEGPGCVTSLWLTVADAYAQLLVRRRVAAHQHLWILVYYDGEEAPAIEAPIGLFFGNGTPRYVHFSSRFVGMTSGGYYSFLPMPFASSCRVVMENRHPRREIPLFYGAVTYHQLPGLEADVGRLHTQARSRTFTRSGRVEGCRVPHDPTSSWRRSPARGTSWG